MEARKKMSTNTKEDPKCCHRTRMELDDLHGKHFGQPIWATLFFMNDQAPAPFVVRSGIPSSIPRCIKCGHTIDEHAQGSPPIRLPNAVALDDIIAAAEPVTMLGIRQLLQPIVQALLPNPWEDLSNQTRMPSFLGVLERDWKVNAYPKFCCILQGVYGEDCAKFHPSCECWTVGAHILPRSTRGKLQSIQLLFPRWTAAEIDSAQNGLPLCKEFEEAFDNLSICLVFEQGWWVVKVLDPLLSGAISLTNCMTRTATKFQPSNLSWKLVHNARIRISDVVSRRALVLHAHFCHAKHKLRLSPALYDGDAKRVGSPPKDFQQWLQDVNTETGGGTQLSIPTPPDQNQNAKWNDDDDR
jgi:hypothetical protein